jgi:hypothetical protein
MEALKDDIEATTGLSLLTLPRWLNEKRALERFKKDEIAYSKLLLRCEARSKRTLI